MFTCYYCNKAVASTPSLLVTHIRTFCKSTVENSNLRCGEPGCYRHYFSAVSFKKHLVRDHQSLDVNLHQDRNVIVMPIDILDSPLTSSEITTPSESVKTSLVTQENFNCLTHHTNFNCLTHHAGLLISSLYASPIIPRKTVQEVMQNLQIFLKKSENILFKQFNDLMPSNEITDNVSSALSTTLNTFSDTFDNFNTEHKRIRHFNLLGTYNEPQEVKIGRRLDTKKTPHGLVLAPIDCTEQILPLKNNLELFFSMGNVLKDTLEYLGSLQEQVFGIENVVQGTVWKKMIENSVGLVLPLIIYFDDFEIGNPLGSHAGVHKLGGVYVSLPCLPSNYVSLLQNIFMLALFHSSDRARFGNNIMFQKVFDVLNDLKHNGITVKNDVYTGVIKFYVSAVTGDNLGLNGILGFVESFSANRPCRICNASKSQIRSMLYEDSTLLRNERNYMNDLQLHNISETGIKEQCAWLVLDGFDLFQNVAVDVLHDYLEGSCRYVMQFVITNIVRTQKLISLENLASRIRYFNYGPDSTSKPSNAVTTEGASINLKFSAAVMLCLVRYFGLIVGYNVPDENEVWLLYIKLRQLLDKLLSRRIHDSTIEQVKFLVSEINELYCELSKMQLKPKFHFLTHYPQMLRKFGPLTQIWTMRFEAKHRISKFIARATQSRINVCKTIAIKHQSILNDTFLKKQLLVPFKCGKLKKVAMSEILVNGLDFETQGVYDDYSYATSWVMLNSIKFEGSSILVLDISESTCLPVFAEVKNIYVTESSKVIFHCISLECIDFNDHFFAYEVTKTSNHLLYAYDNLFSPVPATITVLPNMKLYITVRWTLD